MLFHLVFQPSICRADSAVLVVRKFVSFHEFFQFRKQIEVTWSQDTHLIARQLKHWLPSKMPALNYSATHRIRHSYSYCTTNGWLKTKNNNSSTTESELWRNAGPGAILVAGEYVKKVTKCDVCISQLTVAGVSDNLPCSQNFPVKPGRQEHLYERFAKSS